MKEITNDHKFKEMKTVFNTLLIIMLFSVAVQAQPSAPEPPNGNTEKVEFASMNELIDHLEAVKKGEAEPIDKVILEKEYARLIEEMDSKYHSATPKMDSKDVGPTSETIIDAPLEMGDTE